MRTILITSLKRGNGRTRTFFADDDYEAYRDLLADNCATAGVVVWAWVMMPNHVHLILAPSDPDGIRRALASVHRRYVGRIHARLKRTGHFWQGRFGCVAMDDDHVGVAVRYVLMNPVRAGLVEQAAEWRWSSVHAHLGTPDGVTDPTPVADRFPDLPALLALTDDEAATARLRRAETIGRPLGNAEFLADLERASGRILAQRRRGPKPRARITGGDLIALMPAGVGDASLG